MRSCDRSIKTTMIKPSFCAAAPPSASLDVRCSLWFWGTEWGEPRNMNNMSGDPGTWITWRLTLGPSCPSCSGTPASALAPWTPRSASAAPTRSSPPWPPASRAFPAAAWAPSEATELRRFVDHHIHSRRVTDVQQEDRRVQEHRRNFWSRSHEVFSKMRV